MKAIYKYVLSETDEQVLQMPISASILSIKNQDNNIVLYAKIDKDIDQNLKEPRTVYIFGTGHDIPNTLNAYFLDTVVTYDGSLVWHVFIKN